MGNGLVTELRMDRWTRNRALFNPAFHRRYSDKRTWSNDCMVSTILMYFLNGDVSFLTTVSC